MANVTIANIAGGEDTSPANTSKIEIEVGGVSKFAQLVNILKNAIPIGGTTPAAGAFTTLKQTTGKAAGAIPISDADGALTLTASTGTGAPVRATSPTLVTPTIISTTSVADDAEITLDTAKTGWGTAMAGVNEEIIKFRFTAAGVVTVISNSANAINTDTDGCLCVYDAGAGIAIKNRLGATKNIRYFINYS